MTNAEFYAERIKNFNGTNFCNEFIKPREGEMPAVFHRRDRQNWKVTLQLDDFMRLYKYFSDKVNEVVEILTEKQEVEQ